MPGVHITLCGLVAAPHLNGQQGRLVQYSEEKGRWECALDNGHKVNVKATNFTIATEFSEEVAETVQDSTNGVGDAIGAPKRGRLPASPAGGSVGVRRVRPRPA